MLTLLEALDELNSKSESELTLDYLEELAKKVSIEDPHANANAVTYLYSGMGDAMEQYVGNPNIRIVPNWLTCA